MRFLLRSAVVVAALIVAASALGAVAVMAYTTSTGGPYAGCLSAQTGKKVQVPAGQIYNVAIGATPRAACASGDTQISVADRVTRTFHKAGSSWVKTGGFDQTLISFALPADVTPSVELTIHFSASKSGTGYTNCYLWTGTTATGGSASTAGYHPLLLNGEPESGETITGILPAKAYAGVGCYVPDGTLLGIQDIDFWVTEIDSITEMP